MRIDIISILPDIFESVLGSSMLGIARDKGVVEFHVHDLRDWAEDRHRTTDDYPFGGGHGMVMKPDPIFRAVRAVEAESPQVPIVLLVSPQGRLLDQALVEELAASERLVIICGRYEGFDDRIPQGLHALEVSIGDFVLSGGEIPALVVLDATVRLVPGVLGDETSAAADSFSTGLLEHPHYTRPPMFRGMTVPPVLLSGDHQAIALWRRKQALRRTRERRPDLLTTASLSDLDRQFLVEIEAEDAGIGREGRDERN